MRTGDEYETKEAMGAISITAVFVLTIVIVILLFILCNREAGWTTTQPDPETLVIMKKGERIEHGRRVVKVATYKLKEVRLDTIQIKERSTLESAITRP